MLFTLSNILFSILIREILIFQSLAQISSLLKISSLLAAHNLASFKKSELNCLYSFSYSTFLRLPVPFILNCALIFICRTLPFLAYKFLEGMVLILVILKLLSSKIIMNI